MPKFTLDADLALSQDVQYAIYKTPATGTSRMLGDAVATGFVGPAPTNLDAVGNVVIDIQTSPDLPFPATYLLLMQGVKNDKKWGTGRIPFTYNGPGSESPPPGTSPPPAGELPAAIWGTTEGVGGNPTVYGPKQVFWYNNASYQFTFTISGPRRAVNNSYQSWGEPGQYITAMDGVDQAAGTYRAVFHTNGLAAGSSYDYVVIAMNDNGQTRHTFRVNVYQNPDVVNPPPPDPGNPGGNIPFDVNKLARAPWFRDGLDYTTKWSTQEDYSFVNNLSDWGSFKIRGAFHCEANSWAIKPRGEAGWWLMGNPNLFSMYCAASEMSSDNTINFYLNAHCAVGLQKSVWGPGAHSEVKAYPSFGMGAIMGVAHLQDRKGIPANIAAPLPCRLDAITSFFVGWRKKTLNVSSNAIGHLCHDIRVCVNGNRTSTDSGYASRNGLVRPEQIFGTEFMIVHKQFGGYGNVNYRGTGKRIGTPTIDGMKHHVYIQEGASVRNGRHLMLLCFVPEPVNLGGELPDQFNIAPILDYCHRTTYRQIASGPGGSGGTPQYFWVDANGAPFGMDHPLMPPDSFFHQDVLGIEIEEGDFEITLEDAFCFVNKY